ncbi:MAG: type II secretion system F family protein [Candidatus Aenigmarchaeota archaeon]|nr:type II secretion system F family protein [Candidatus Aenigmarchaeota archaeon]
MKIGKTIIHEAIFIAVGILIIVLNVTIISQVVPFIAPLINVLGAMIAIVPPFLIFYGKYRMNKEIEEQFIIFITDLTQAIDSGMTLPIALKHSAKKDYRSLTPYVREINSKVDWGIPFEKTLKLFAKKMQSSPIKRSVSTIIETYKVGGKISDTLKAIGQSLIEINKIKQERSASVQSQIVTSYLIFFIFIFILVILKTFLIPALGGMNTPTMGEMEGNPSVPIEVYTQAFINFIIVQGFFAGLATGKMAEGSIISGLKHSIVLISIGYTIFSIFGQLQLSLF